MREWLNRAVSKTDFALLASGTNLKKSTCRSIVCAEFVFQAGQKRRSHTRSSRSEAAIFNRFGAERPRTASWWRRAMFSNRSSAYVLKAERRAVTTINIDLNMDSLAKFQADQIQ